MEILRGSPALSGFRTQALVRRAQQQQLPLTALDTEYVHFVALNADLEADSRNTLIQLLDSPAQGITPAPDSIQVIVTPRPGTLSPWSTKATDIAHNCGLHQVKRIERGICYYLSFSTTPSDDELNAVKALLHDRMTEVTLNELSSDS